ncbi:hypothetical protein [Kitasatospora cinereorecta]|uniref:Uncharacterized protein n=1 Tax=Kitasatospora cinereorecta TaxID=285560 RepID=A0ABW0VHL9_9ACTN
MTTIRPPHPGTATNFLVKTGFPKYTGPAAGSGFRSRSTTPEQSGAAGGIVTVRWISTAPVPELADLETERMLSSLPVALAGYGYAVRHSMDPSSGRPRPTLVLVEERNANAQDLVAPPAHIALVDTSAQPVTYTVRFQRVLGKDWQQTAAGLTTHDVDTALARPGARSTWSSSSWTGRFGSGSPRTFPCRPPRSSCAPTAGVSSPPPAGWAAGGSTR